MPRSIPQTRSDFEDHEGPFSRILTRLNSLWVATTYPFAAKGRKISLHYASEISRTLAPHFRVGNRVEIGRDTWFHTWCTLCTANRHEVNFEIEDDCRIGARCTITAENSIHLERGVVLEPDVLIMDHAHAYQDVSRPISLQGATPGGRIRIQEGCRIGRGAAILCEKGDLVLGPNCVVAPGAVVARSFPAGSMLSGNPARAVREPGPSHAETQAKISVPNNGGEIPRLKQAAETFTSGKEGLSAPRRSDIEGSDGSSSVYSTGRINEDPLTWVSRGASKIRRLWLAHTYPFVAFGKGAWLHYSCRVTRSAAKYVSIGERVGLGRGAQLEVSANPGANPPILILESGSGLQRRCLISAQNRIHVMKDVLFGPSVLVMDHARAATGVGGGGQTQEPQGGIIRIEDDCWIGFGTVIICEQGELVIGRHSVVGANSVVTRSIPPYSVVAGDPARIVKQYDFAQGKWVLGCVRPRAGASREHPEPVASALS